jgi:hypothetical protein
MRRQLAIHESYTAPKWVRYRTGQWNGTPVRAGFLHSDSGPDCPNMGWSDIAIYNLHIFLVHCVVRLLVFRLVLSWRGK